MKRIALILVLSFLLLGSARAHCDSYDGPVIREAMQALETNNVKLLYKWIAADHEAQVTSLFHKTYALKGGDAEIYGIVEKHFLETLVRLHRETEGAPFTGIKPAGQVPRIVQMSDSTVADGDIDGLLTRLNNHINSVAREKFAQVEALAKVKDNSAEQGREYVRAYVDFTHTILGLHDVIEKAPAACDH